MPIEPLSLLLLALLGGAVAVDGTSFGQFMISRPFVAATLAGLVVGAPAEGAAIGVVLEAFHLTVLPVGAARYPEGGPAAVAAGAAFALSGGGPVILLVTVLLALLLEWVGGETVRFMRHGNVRLISEDHRPRATARGLERRHLLAIGIDYLRGAALAAAGFFVLVAAARVAPLYWGLDESVARVALAALVPALLVSAFRMVGWRGWFVAAGALSGIALLLLGG